MTPEEIQRFPLAILKDIQNLITVFEELYKKNSDIILRSDVRNADILQFINIENNDFSFRITNPKLENNKIIYFCHFKPSNESNFEGKSSSSDVKTVITWFNRWTDLMRELSKYRILLSEPFLKEYTDEFFAEFEFVEESDDNSPYETQKQIALYDALAKLELNLRNQEQTTEVEKIIEETVHLKNNIQNISKGATKKKVAEIFAKIKKTGIKFFKDVVEVGYKEIIKAALHSGVDSIGNLLR